MSNTNSLLCMDEVLVDTDSPVELDLEAKKYGRNYLFMSASSKRRIDAETDGVVMLDEQIETDRVDQNTPIALDDDEDWAVQTPTLMHRATTPPPAPQKKKSARARYQRHCAWHLESEFAAPEFRTNRALNF